jgi:hypothetical protein
VDRQLDTRRNRRQDHQLPALRVEPQRLDVDARTGGVLEQRDVVDVDGEDLVLRQRDQRQRSAGAGGGDPRSDGCGHEWRPFR